MKTKLRSIVVNSQAFFYWYSGGKNFNLEISPKHNKNINIKLVFEAQPPEEDKYTFWVFYKISATKNNKEITIEIAKPKFIASLIEYLLLTQKHLFTQRNLQIIDAMQLLNEMGYFDLKPEWIEEW